LAATVTNVIYVGGQLSEMKSSSAQTDKLIASNAQLAIAAKTNAEAALKQAGAAEKQATAMQGQLDAMERDQVPYVSISDRPGNQVCESAPFATTPPTARIVWNWHSANFGKGCAVNVRTEQSFLSIMVHSGEKSTSLRRPSLAICRQHLRRNLPARQFLPLSARTTAIE
jgi:hypothetical protein